MVEIGEEGGVVAFFAVGSWAVRGLREVGHGCEGITVLSTD